MDTFSFALLLVSLFGGCSAVPHYNRYGYRKYPSSGLCYYYGKYIPCSSVYNYRKYNSYRTKKPFHAKTNYPYHYQTTTTTTTTTLDPAVQQSLIIRDRYIAASNISSGNLFAFNVDESMRFTSRVFDELIRPSTDVCQRQLPRFTDCKIQELAFILLNSPCISTNSTANATSSNGNGSQQQTTTQKPTTTVKVDEKNKVKSRKRRNLNPGDVINNSDGTVTSIIRCERKGTRTRNNNLLLCNQCFAITNLGTRKFPQFINEVVCDTADNLCFSSTGACIEGTITLNFLEDVNSVGLDRLGEWVESPQRIRSSCTCQMFPNSALAPFV